MDAVHLIVFSRAPQLGSTKTRLAAEVGAEAARDFHAACLVELLALCEEFRVRGGAPPGGQRGGYRVGCHLFITPPGSEADFRRAGVRWPQSFAVHPQRGQTLGRRMAAALETVLAGGPPGAGAILIGSDLPLLTGEHLAAAAAGLERADAVLGPTEDGGYYLVAVRQPQPALFDLPAWGDCGVLPATLARAREAGLSAATIATLPDGDTLADLARVRAHPLFAQLAGRRAVGLVAALLARGGAKPATPGR